MAKNEYLPFGVGPNANVLTNDDYQALPARTTGFVSGVAHSRELNTAWRQSSVIAAALAQFIADTSGVDVVDNGDVDGLKLQLIEAINKTIPVGTPQPWPTATPPTGWLKCNGSSFNKALYPNLALAYPNGVLPDLRGEFIRGWDDGRGVDTARALMSHQASTRIENVLDTGANPDLTKFNITDAEGATSELKNAVGTIQFAGNSVRTSFRVRVRNIAFNYIVRAA